MRKMEPTKPISTPIRDQVYRCSDCGKEFRPGPAFGSWSTRPVVTKLNNRFRDHACNVTSRP